MQEPKHYIFHARNPVNGLVYGHQAMIAYNRELGIIQYWYGSRLYIRFGTRSNVPILSGTAEYAHTPLDGVAYSI
jgi:hypothetical protein